MLVTDSLCLHDVASLSATSQHFNQVLSPMLLSIATTIHRYSDGSTPLTWAAMEGRTSLVGRLLDHGAEVAQADKFGKTALHQATDREHKDTVELLLERGADVNATDWGRMTPLHLAIKNWDTGVAKLLIEARANVDASADYSICDSHYDLYLSFYSSRYPEIWDMAPLDYAATDGSPSMVQFLLDSGASVDRQSNSGHGALHYAAAGGSKKVAQMLIDAGADVNREDSRAQTPLHFAAEHGSVSVAKLLIDHPTAYLNGRDTYQRTPLHLAAAQDNHIIVDMLIDAGALITRSVAAYPCVGMRYPVEFAGLFPIIFQRSPDDEFVWCELTREEMGHWMDR